MDTPQETPHSASAAPRVIVERPASELAQGQYAWPDWGIALLGGLGVAAGLFYLLLRRRTRHRSS